MAGVLTSFVVVLSLIAVGYVAARTGVVPPGSDRLLARLVFYIAMPALLFVTMLDAQPGLLFSRLLVGVVLSVLLTGALFLVLTPRRLPPGERVIGALASCYVNAGNLGIPIAAYVLGDAALVAPVLFVQLLVLAPIGLASLDRLGAGTRAGVRSWLRPITNPVVIGAFSGLVIGLLPLELPDVIVEPLALLAGSAVPLALFLYGVSLVGSVRSGALRPTREVRLVMVLKNLAHPLIAYMIGAFLLDLPPEQLLTLTVLSALPTAQNIFVYALRYDSGVGLARSAVFATTALALPMITAVALIFA